MVQAPSKRGCLGCVGCLGLLTIMALMGTVISKLPQSPLEQAEITAVAQRLDTLLHRVDTDGEFFIGATPYGTDAAHLQSGIVNVSVTNRWFHISHQERLQLAQSAWIGWRRLGTPYAHAVWFRDQMGNNVGHVDVWGVSVD